MDMSGFGEIDDEGNTKMQGRGVSGLGHDGTRTRVMMAADMSGDETNKLTQELVEVYPCFDRDNSTVSKENPSAVAAATISSLHGSSTASPSIKIEATHKVNKP